MQKKTAEFPILAKISLQGKCIVKKQYSGDSCESVAWASLGNSIYQKGVYPCGIAAWYAVAFCLESVLNQTCNRTEHHAPIFSQAAVLHPLPLLLFHSLELA